MEIRTNNKPRNIIQAYELTKKEVLEFDYLEGERLDFASFFVIKAMFTI